MTTKPVSKEIANLARDLIKVCEALELRYGLRKPSKPTDFIEALIFQILELGVSEKSARDALRRLREEYVDWNDARVATVREIEDILGARYYQVREKSEDIRHLLADFYTAFRTMNLGSQLTPEGVETLLALPETTNVRKDMVERALVLCHETRLFPCDDDHFQLLKLLSGYFEDLALSQAQRLVEEALDIELMLRLSRGLREHVHVYQTAGEDEPQIIAFGWDQPDPLKMDKGKRPSTKTIKVEVVKPEKKPEPKVEPTVEADKAEPITEPKVEPPKAELKAEKAAPAKTEAKKVEAKKAAPKTAKPAAKPEKKPAAAKADKKPAANAAPKAASKAAPKAAKPAAKADKKPVAKPAAAKAKTGSHKAAAPKKKK